MKEGKGSDINKYIDPETEYAVEKRDTPAFGGESLLGKSVLPRYFGNGNESFVVREQIIGSRSIGRLKTTTIIVRTDVSGDGQQDMIITDLEGI